MNRDTCCHECGVTRHDHGDIDGHQWAGGPK